VQIFRTGGPRYMREIRTPKIGSHITNSHIKRPRITVNQRIGYRKEAISGSHIRKTADKKTAYNEDCLYCMASKTCRSILTKMLHSLICKKYEKPHDDYNSSVS
jgi:hypothetical protein